MLGSSSHTAFNVAQLSQVGFDPTLDEDRKTPLAHPTNLTHQV